MTSLHRNGHHGLNARYWLLSGPGVAVWGARAIAPARHRVLFDPQPDSVNRPDGAGIGVIEILIAIVLIGVMTVLLLPSLERYQKVRELRHASRQLLSDVRLTQQHAVTLDENVRLVYAAGTPGSYTVEKVSDGGDIKQVTLPTGVTVSGSFASTALQFSATGAPAAPGQFCLTEGTQIIRLDVAAATGRAILTEVTTCP